MVVRSAGLSSRCAMNSLYSGRGENSLSRRTEQAKKAVRLRCIAIGSRESAQGLEQLWIGYDPRHLVLSAQLASGLHPRLIQSRPGDENLRRFQAHSA